MAPPKGSKYALGHGFGRPRTSCPEDEELEELGKDLVAWAFEPDPEKGPKKIHLKQWYALKHGIIENHFKLMCGKNIFYPYYKMAKELISIRYIDGTVNPSIAHRFMRHYFDEVKKDEDDVVKMKEEIKNLKNEEKDDDLVRKLAQALENNQRVSDSSKSGQSSVENE